MPVAFALLALLGAFTGEDACTRIVQEAGTRGIRCTCTYAKASASYRLKLTDPSSAGIQAAIREKITPLLEIVGRIDGDVTGETGSAWVETTGFTVRARLPRDCAKTATPGTPQYTACLRPAIRVQGKPPAGAGERESPPALEPLRITPDMDILPPELVRRTEPAYPEDAKKAGVEGEIVLECIVTEAGDVRVGKILKSLPPLDDAAIAAVQQWKYKPAVRAGTPQAVVLIVRVAFHLESKMPGE